MAASPPPSDSAVRRWLLLVALIAAVYLGAYLLRGWYPHDEGMLGQAAERVLQGEVPHRDFDEPYTGLLTYMHAAAFAIGGVRLPVLRVPLFLFALAWIVAVYRIALRFAGPSGAAVIALTALAWSVPNYPASMPSWYNLFFATFGTLALMRWGESNNARWLFWAGVAGGVSFLFKLSGLFYVAAAMLFLVYAITPERSGKMLAAAISLGLLALVLALWRLVAPFYWPRVIYHFVLPGGVIAIALAFREWRLPRGDGAERAQALFKAGALFLAGVILPVALFGAGFAAAGALPALLHGVFVAPLRRLTFASMPPPALFWVLASAPLAILLRPRRDWNERKWLGAALVVAILFGLVLAGAWVDSFPHRLAWQSVRGLIPLAAVVAAAVVASRRLSLRWAAGAANNFVLLAMVTAFTSLIQFPYSSPVYFLYVAPLLLLTLVMLVRGIRRTPAPLAAVTLGFYLVFAVLLVTPTALVGMGYYRADLGGKLEALDLPRGGLRMLPEDARLYGALIPEIQMRAQGGAIWAGPDAPEVYFLGGFRNHSRAMFEFLDESESGAGLLHSIDSVRVIVVNTRPGFSATLSAELLDSLRVRFPEGHGTGRFEIRWRR